METVALSYNEYAGTMMSDMSCDWIGFVPHNVYDREVYKDLSMYGLIVFNNDMVSFQEAVIEFITNHPMYKDHAILRDEWYRFQYFKMLRKDPIALAAAYRHYIDAAKNTCLIHEVPKDILETQIGVHFLHHPDLFFELLEFSILKGEIYV